MVSLATAKRVGELQDLSRVVPCSGDDLILSYLMFFVAKTESPSNPVPRFVGLRSLGDFAKGLEEGSLLCPVRALSIYLQRTKGITVRASSYLFRLIVLCVPFRKMLCHSFYVRSSVILELLSPFLLLLEPIVFAVWRLRFLFA